MGIKNHNLNTVSSRFLRAIADDPQLIRRPKYEGVIEGVLNGEYEHSSENEIPIYTNTQEQAATILHRSPSLENKNAFYFIPHNPLYSFSSEEIRKIADGLDPYRHTNGDLSIHLMHMTWPPQTRKEIIEQLSNEAMLKSLDLNSFELPPIKGRAKNLLTAPKKARKINETNIANYEKYEPEDDLYDPGSYSVKIMNELGH